MRGLQNIFYGLSHLWSKQRTLQKRTWQTLLQRSPGLRVIRTERIKAQRYRARNSFKGAFAQVISVFILLVALSFIPAHFTDHYFHWLEWFKFNEDQKAFSTISEVMGATATIIGLSFVVIGFLFDIVRDKTQRTLNELFRATYLFFVFGISVVSIMTLVILNCFKYTVSAYIARNFAVLSSLILLIDVGAIAFLFYQLLRFFNPDRVAEIASRELMDMARFRLLNDRYSWTSGEVYQERLQAYGFQEKFEYASFLTKGKPAPLWLKVGNLKDVDLVDVHFPLLRLLTHRLKKRSTENGFATLRCGNTIRPNQGILSLSNGTKLHRAEQLLLSAAYLTSRPASDADDFDLMKEQLEKRLLKASSDGDLDGIKQALDDIEKLYDIFYKSNA